jgi:hypothetical protein
VIVTEIENLIAPELIAHFSEKWNHSYLYTRQIILTFTTHYIELLNRVNEKTKKQIYTNLSYNVNSYKQLQQINTSNLVEEPWLIRDAVSLKRILKANNIWKTKINNPSMHLTPTAFEAMETIGLIITLLHYTNKIPKTNKQGK